MRWKALLVLLAIVAAPTVVLAFFWPLHGLRADYRVMVDGQPVDVAGQTDLELYFPNKKVLHTPVMLHWDHERLGSNRKLPELDVVWNGWLKAPRTGRYYFYCTGADQFILNLDGQALSFTKERNQRSIELTKGMHHLIAQYRGHDKFSVSWTPPHSFKMLISFNHFYLTDGRTWPEWLVLSLALAMLVFEIWLFGRFWPAATGDLWSMARKRWYLAGVIVLLVLTFGARHYRYLQIPYLTETCDEYCAVLNGLNLVYQGYPSAWSMMKGYRGDQREMHYIFENSYPIVKPYFDHPPGFNLLLGFYLKLRGVQFSERYEHYFEDQTRWIPIFFSLVNLLLLLKLAQRIFRRKETALLAGLFFALLPTAAFTGRLVKEEHILLACLLGAILLTLRYLESGKRRLLIAAALVAGTSCLFKVPGIAVVGGIAAICLAHRRWKAAAFVLVVGLAFFSIYFIYGAAIDWDTFVAVLRSQESKTLTKKSEVPTLSPNGLAGILGMGNYVMDRYFSLTHLWLLAGLFLLWHENAKKTEKAINYIPVVWPVVVYLAFMAVAINSRWVFGWYRIPLFPFYGIIAAWMIWRMIEEASAPLVTLFCVLPLWEASYWGYFMPTDYHPVSFRLAMLGAPALILATYFLPPERREKPVRYLGVIAAALFFILLGSSIVRRYYQM